MIGVGNGDLLSICAAWDYCRTPRGADFCPSCWASCGRSPCAIQKSSKTFSRGALLLHPSPRVPIFTLCCTNCLISILHPAIHPFRQKYEGWLRRLFNVLT